LPFTGITSQLEENPAAVKRRGREEAAAAARLKK
jgi:hypothetical protein